MPATEPEVKVNPPETNPVKTEEVKPVETPKTEGN